MVRLDPEAMTTVVDNLLSNALKYTPEGGRVRCTLTLEDSDAAQGVHVSLAVEDTGPGIPPAALPHVFERFYRAADGEPGGAAPSAGTGIGLDLAHELVLLHGGTIGVESEVGPGSGTVFTVRLPFEAGLGADDRPGAPTERPSGQSGDGSTAPLLEAAPSKRSTHSKTACRRARPMADPQTSSTCRPSSSSRTTTPSAPTSPSGSGGTSACAWPETASRASPPPASTPPTSSSPTS